MTEEYGLDGGSARVYLNPVAVLSVDESNNPAFGVNATESFAPTGTIQSYEFYGGYAPGAPRPPGSDGRDLTLAKEQDGPLDPTAVVDYSDVMSGRVEGFNSFVGVRVKDENAVVIDPRVYPYGDLYDDRNVPVIVKPGYGRSSAVHDVSGMTITAREKPGDVAPYRSQTEVHRFIADTPSRERTAVLAVAKPQLFRAGQGVSTLLLSGRQIAGNAVSNAWSIFRSNNFGETFTGMTSTPFNASTYKKGVAFCGLSDGSVAAAGIHDGDKRVYFALSVDGGTTWNAPQDTGIDATDVKGDLTLLQESSSGQSSLLLTNGYDFNYRKSNIEDQFVEV